MGHGCLFCDIAAQKTDTQFLYQNASLVVFKDINPHAPVHLLIVPRKHIRSVNDLEEEDGALVGELILTGRRMAREAGIDASGYKLLFNVERGGGQVIFHLHLHLIGGWRAR
jgi:histidine triad (HIT) family protein